MKYSSSLFVLLAFCLLTSAAHSQESETLFGFARNWTPGAEGEINWQVDDLLDALGGSRNTSTSLEMVTLPPGSFLMGNTGSARDTQYGNLDESPRHTVTINYSFQMGKYEVTNAQYAEVLNWAKGRGYLRNSSGGTYNGGDVYHNGQILLNVNDGDSDINYSGGQFFVESRNNEGQDNHPVNEVSWYGSVAFCNWRSQMDGLPAAYDLNTWTLTNRQGGGYRLPSESEWEYACRGSASNPNRYSPFSFGDDTSVDLGSCDYSSLFDRYMVWCGNGGGWTEEVGSRLPNDYGLYGMHGNLWEWCGDWWHWDYNGAPTGGTAWQMQLSSDPHRVFRGGVWRGPAERCRSAYRSRLDPSGSSNSIGFRVSRTL